MTQLMADLKSYSYDDFQQAKAELKSMEADKLNDLQHEADTAHREVTLVVDNMERDNSELENTTQLASRLYSLSNEAKAQIKEINRVKLSERASMFRADLDKASAHLNDVKSQLRQAISNGTEQDIRKLYKSLQSAEYEKEYAEYKRDTFKDIMRNV